MNTSEQEPSKADDISKIKYSLYESVEQDFFDLMIRKNICKDDLPRVKFSVGKSVTEDRTSLTLGKPYIPTHWYRCRSTVPVAARIIRVRHNTDDITSTDLSDDEIDLSDLEQVN